MRKFFAWLINGVARNHGVTKARIGFKVSSQNTQSTPPTSEQKPSPSEAPSNGAVESLSLIHI